MPLITKQLPAGWTQAHGLHGMGGLGDAISDAITVGSALGIPMTCAQYKTTGPFNYSQNLCTVPGNRDYHDATLIAKNPEVFAAEIAHPYIPMRMTNSPAIAPTFLDSSIVGPTASTPGNSSSQVVPDSPGKAQITIGGVNPVNAVNSLVGMLPQGLTGNMWVMLGIGALGLYLVTKK